MFNPRISHIVCIGKNREIGKDNDLLWRIPEDMKRFRDKTRDHVIIMGQKTYDSIGHPLKNRINIVITQDKNFKAEGVMVVYSIEEALQKARELEKEEAFIIGGGSIFKQTIDLVDLLHLTVVDDVLADADTFYPDYSGFKKVILDESHEWSGLKYKYLDLEK